MPQLLEQENSNSQETDLKREKNRSDQSLDCFRDTQPYDTNPYQASYVCLIAPRFEEHTLTGDISDRLPIWMKDICISFGWNLKYIDIKPDYMHWIMKLSITIYPTQFMKIVLQETSKKIFADFPRFKQQNISNDFWAPWYGVNVGQTPYTKEAVKVFLDQVRMQQKLG